MNLSLVEGPPSSLEDALAAEIVRAKAGDPLAPVAVLIGGTLLRPYLQRSLAQLCGGIVNVHLITPSELALALGERALVAAGRRPLPPLGDRILARDVAAQHEGYFAPVRDTPGFGDALHQLFRELRGAGYDAGTLRTALSGACEAPGKDQALISLFTGFLKRRADFYAPDDCLLAAEVKNPPWEALAIYGLWELPGALRRCLERLAQRIPVSLYLPTANHDVAAGVAELRDWVAGTEAPIRGLGSEQIGPGGLHRTLFTRPEQPAALDGSVQLFSGPDPAREVREVARSCLGWAREGIRFHEMAVVYRHADQYRSLIESVFGEAGIPLYLHEGTPMSERPLGRRAIALLDLVDGNFERRAVVDFLADTRLPKHTCEAYGGAPIPRWDRFTREAGIVAGGRQWADRLNLLREQIESGGNEQWRAAQVERIEHLRAFARDLDQALRDHPAAAPWSEHLTAFRRLLERYVSDPDPLLDALEGLERFDQISDTVSFDRFRELLRGAIETLRSDEVLGTRPGAFARRGVNVIDVNSLRHLRFRAVAIVGLTERSFPSPPRQDPLLLDHERQRLNENGPAAIPLRAWRPDPEPLQFALAVSAARERLAASYPRKSSGDGRPQLPSVFFRALAEAMTGERVSAEKVDELPRDLYRRALGSRIGATDVDIALSPAERDRTLLEQMPDLGRAALVGTEPRMDRALRARAARFRPELTAFDAALSDEVSASFLTNMRDPEHPVSPSSLEQYATCPHRFFLDHVLRARPTEEPELTIRISPLHRGTLVHRILERFLSEPPRDGPLLYGPGEQTRLRQIAEEECEAAEDRGETGYGLMWRYDRGELCEDLDQWLEQERQDPSFREMPNGAFELSFGMAQGEDPLEIDAGGVRLHVRGQIDRLQWNENRTAFRVIDYKTGSVRSDHADGELRGGRALQLPLYLLAGARHTGLDAGRGRAEYHFATRKGAFERRGFTGADLAARGNDLDRLLAGIAGAIRAGDFFMAPARGEDDCRWCDFDGLCPASRHRQIEDKTRDPRARALAELREIE